MCTHPITITRNYPLVGTKSYTVPCGKCPECLQKKRSELAALSLLEAQASIGSPWFLTITYDNENCPIAISEKRGLSPVLLGFERGCSDWMLNGHFRNRLIFDESTGIGRACSLCREDIKKWFKRFRTSYSRSHPDVELNFRYLVFGELGEASGRPHYHALVYGLDREQLSLLVDCWNMGFIHCAPSLDKPASLEDVQHISEYCAKYISKGTYSRWQPLLPFVENPRRQSSLHFGLTDDEMILKLASFILPAISMQSLDGCECLGLTSSLYLLIGRRLSLLMAKNFLCHNQ